MELDLRTPATRFNVQDPFSVYFTATEFRVRLLACN